MCRIDWNSGRRRSLLLLLLAFVLAVVSAGHDDVTDRDESAATTTDDHLWDWLVSNDSSSIVEGPEYNLVDFEQQAFLKTVEAQRKEISKSIMNFNFNESRLRVRSTSVKMPEKNKGIIYWMYRDHRVQDNWALLYAQKLAIQNIVPLHVVFFKPDETVKKTISNRQYKFMLEGLKKFELECQTLNIEFHFLIGNSTETLADFVINRSLGTIVVDFSPLRDDIAMVKHLVFLIGFQIPVLQIDAHNVIPCWELAEDQLPSIEATRSRIVKMLDTYLTEFPPVIKHPYTAHPKARPTDWKMFSDLQIDRSVQHVSNFEAGYIPAMVSLHVFKTKKLPSYYSNRINPNLNFLSNLSPWLHFGQISAQRVLLEVLKLKYRYQKCVESYEEEILYRREMFECLCYHNKNYDKMQGGPSWGRYCLNTHRNDTRTYLYTREELEYGQTSDVLWNAAHNQMIVEGKTHRFLRPYWAKKILEFTKTPEEAVDTANYLNNKYSLDGNDPSGFGGVLWALTGLYDMVCSADNPIIGRIRSIPHYWIRSKFNFKVYIRKYESYLYSGSGY